MNDAGAIEPLGRSSIEIFKEIERETANNVSGHGWAALVQWFLQDRSTRTISPFCKLTMAEYVNNCIKENTKGSLQEAERLGGSDIKSRLQAVRSSQQAATQESPKQPSTPSTVPPQERRDDRKDNLIQQTPPPAIASSVPVTVRVKKFNVVIRLPGDLFPDAGAKFDDPAVDSISSSNGLVLLRFVLGSGPLSKSYESCLLSPGRKATAQSLQQDSYATTGRPPVPCLFSGLRQPMRSGRPVWILAAHPILPSTTW